MDEQDRTIYYRQKADGTGYEEWPDYPYDPKNKRSKEDKVVEALQDLTAATLTAMDWVIWSVHGGLSHEGNMKDAVADFKKWKEVVKRGTNARTDESKSDQKDVG